MDTDKKLEALDRKVSRLVSLLEKVLKTTTEDQWITEQQFQLLTGLNTKEKLRYLRSQHPELWRAKTTTQDKNNRTVNRGFMYNYTLYKDMFKSPLDSTYPADLRA